jgi:hypothetical protein
VTAYAGVSTLNAMPRVHFKGRVLPSVMLVTISDLHSVHWEQAELNLTMDITTRITNSVVDMQFDVNHFDETDPSPLLMRAWDLSRAAVDIFAFTSGMGLTVHLDTLVKPNGDEASILPQMPTLAGCCTAFDVRPGNTGNNNLDAFYRLVVSEPPLFMAINDLIVSITIPHHASVNCARAIEGLRVLMVPAGVDRRQGWPLMRQNLNLDQTYVTFITDVSTAPRHGDRTHIPGVTVIETVTRSWIIMNRFLEFRKRGNQPLPLADFPLLS